MPRGQNRRFVRVLTAVAATIAVLTGTALTAAQATAAPRSIYCSTTSDERQPVLLVHGYNSGPQTWGDASRRQLAAAGSSTCIDVFDYAERSTNWVTDDKIGPALASRIDTLAAASNTGHGSGKVIVVAHSMGGLATRCAASSTCNGGRTGVDAHIAELISFGTPNTGSWLVGPTLHDIGRTGGSLLSAACYLSARSDTAICEQVRALGTSDATRAFKPDSEQLTKLPQLPSTVPVYALAAQVEFLSSFFGLNEVDLGSGGDVIVREDSALAAARKIAGLGGTQTINCGKIDITDLLRSAHSCWHVTETNDTRFLEAAAHQISLVENSFAPPTPTSTQVLNSAIPAGSCGDDGGDTNGWPQPVPIQLHNGSGTARNADGSFAGSSIDAAQVLGFTDIDGDGRKDVVLQFTCFGSTPEQCCAGRNSHATFIDALAVGRDGGLRLIGPVIRAGYSKPGDQFGPAERDITSATLSGSTITTLEHIYYYEQYTAEQVGGEPTAPVSVRHRFRGGKWSTG